MLHVLPYCAHDLRRRRKCVDMYYRPDTYTTTMILLIRVTFWFHQVRVKVSFHQ